MQIIRAALLAVPAIITFTILVNVFDDKDTKAVRYDGDTLYVNAIPYPRGQASGDHFDAGAVSVHPQTGKSSEVNALLARLGLTIAEQTGSDFIVEVPMGFEQQWAHALSNFPEVAWTGAGDDQAQPQAVISESTIATLEPIPPATSSLIPAPGEPTEADLSRLEFQIYDAITKAGGMPVTVTATGTSLMLRPTLYSVRKESCKHIPNAPANSYECSLIISLSLEEDGSNPSEKGERISVKWDGERGEWTHF